jgi:AraC-like DNA-binding protein
MGDSGMLHSIAVPWVRWRSDDYPAKQRYDAWYSALNDSHLPWVLGKPDTPQFNGNIDMRRIGDVRLLHCRCDPCCGSRTGREISRNDEEYFGLLLIYDGNELVRCGGNDILLGKYDFLLWDSNRPIEFELKTGIKKVTLLVPQDILRQRMPHIDRCAGRMFSMNSGLGAVTASHIITLGQETNSIEEGSANTLVDLTLELVTTCLESHQARPTTKARSSLLAEIKEYIGCNLDDPDLNPETLARHANISVRYLHMLFQESGISVSAWILKERLEKCRRELTHHDAVKKSITEIAFGWGFNDSAHFCRTFKKFYGLSPRDYQKNNLQ